MFFCFPDDLFIFTLLHIASDFYRLIFIRSKGTGRSDRGGKLIRIIQCLIVSFLRIIPGKDKRSNNDKSLVIEVVKNHCFRSKCELRIGSMAFFGRYIQPAVIYHVISTKPDRTTHKSLPVKTRPLEFYSGCRKSSSQD